MIVYTPFWEFLKKNGISGYTMNKMGIDYRTLHKLRHNQNITTVTINKICNLLSCQPNDIMLHVQDSDEETIL